MNHVKEGAIDVGTDIFNAASDLFSNLFDSSESSDIVNYSSYDGSDGLTVMVSGRKTMILDSDGNTLQRIGENLFRFNDNINLLIT